MLQLQSTLLRARVRAGSRHVPTLSHVNFTVSRCISRSMSASRMLRSCKARCSLHSSSSPTPGPGKTNSSVAEVTISCSVTRRLASSVYNIHHAAQSTAEISCVDPILIISLSHAL